MQNFGPNELLEDVINRNFCIGCGACMDLCPYFKSYKGKTSMLFPCTLKEGRCFAYCPKAEVDLDLVSKEMFDGLYKTEPLGYHREVKISKAGTQINGGNFQAGGTVSALMSFALNKGYIDAAVLTDRDGLLPVPLLATDNEAIFRCSSSKYVASPTLSVLNQAIKEGYNRIGIVATPCQTLATAQMRSNPMEDKDFIDPIGLVIGLFCTWALDFMTFKAFISKRTNVDKIKKMDIPPPPAEIMEIFTEDEKFEIPLNEIREFIPNTCSYCMDMTSEFSDISVGVLEGRPDMNTIIIRTQRGQQILDEAQKEGYLMIDDIPNESLAHLKEAAHNKKKRALIKAKQDSLLNTEEGKRSYIRVKPETVEKIIV
jgi:coenzyme F420 hydrogenase subunit beta